MADAVHPLPPRGPGYFAHFASLRAAYVDVWILFTNSLRGDLEAWLAGAPQRFGISRHGRPRPLLTDAWPLPGGFDESRHHQLELWEAFLRNFGLAVPPLLSPVGGTSAGPTAPIALIPGSENNPSKRWPVAHWRSLIEGLPGERFVVFGTRADIPIAEAVAKGFPRERVENRAGRTDLPSFVEGLASCRLLVTNDTGGMHLANARGVPLFGPTNPVRTGPVFAASSRILQPPGCPPTGGAPLASLPAETVVAAVVKT